MTKAQARRRRQRSDARHSIAAVASSNGAFSHKNTEFTYTTPTGGHAVINVVGLGNLAGTTVDGSGALHLHHFDGGRAPAHLVTTSAAALSIG